MSHHDLLFELGTEELPSGSVKPLAEQLANHIKASLTDAKLSFGDVNYFATPRRLAVIIKAVQAKQDTQHISKRGPSVAAGLDEAGEPTKALQGFARSCGVAVSALQTTETDKGQWYIYESEQAGDTLKNLLPAIITTATNNITIPKPMRWGDGDIAFARPVHWALLKLDKTTVTGFDVLGVPLGKSSYGHRFHAPKAKAVASPLAYEDAMKEAYVIAEFSQRRALIKEKVQDLAKSHKATAIMPEDLLDEVTSIVEWPCPLLVPYSERFLALPSEVLIASMQAHQKCFALSASPGKLLAACITVSNIDSQDPQQVIAGNEKVIEARLSDAAFFFEQDQKSPLASLAERTERVTFQEKLGTLADKARRVGALMQALVQPLSLNHEGASRAAALSKCDLMTGMVDEFPELQGTMGYYYAEADGEAEDVAIALKEQYLPRFSKDELPASRLGMALSLADRLDTLVGLFAIGQRPTGVKDPFKLRRHALAVARILIATPEPLTLPTLLATAYQGYGDVLKADKQDAVCNDVQAFILDRLQAYYQAQDTSAELLDAVLSQESDWLFDVDRRLHALKGFVTSDAATSLAAACRRVDHLLKHAKNSDKTVDISMLQESAEKTLHSSLQALNEELKQAYLDAAYETILQRLSTLRPTVDDFFDQVMVMVDDTALKDNRLTLLSDLQTILNGVATMSMIPGQPQ